MGWKTASHTVWDCKYHLIWCPKRRHRLGGVEIREWLAETIRRIGEEFEIEVEELEVSEDHVHVFVSFPPRYSIAKVVGIIKSISASRAFKEYGQLRERFWGGELWEDGYAVRTVGDEVTAEIIKRYIQRHEGGATNQPELF